MNTMAPEPLPETGEPTELEITYNWNGEVLELQTGRGAAKLAVQMDWTDIEDPEVPGHDLEILVQSLPGILAAVKDHVEQEQKSDG